MKYIFLDLEMNNHCPKNNIQNLKGLEKFTDEIMEIGVVILNDDLEEEYWYQSFTKPYVYKNVNPKIYKLTNISMNKLIEKGKYLSQALKPLNDTIMPLDEFILFTWGSYDKDVLIQNCKINDVNIPKVKWIFGSIDLQERFSDIYKYKFKKNQVGLDRALEFYNINITKNKQRHRATNDARYTSLVFKTMLKRLGIKNVVKMVECNELYSRKKHKKEYKKIFKLIENKKNDTLPTSSC